MYSMSLVINNYDNEVGPTKMSIIMKQILKIAWNLDQTP